MCWADNITKVDDFKTFQEVIKGKGGFISAHWDGTNESEEAIKKATDDAKKNMVKVPLKEGRTLHHDMKGHYGAGRVVLRSAPAGTGIIAGGPMRAVFETLGIQDIVAKSIGTSQYKSFPSRSNIECSLI